MRNAKRIIAMMIVVAMMAMTLVSCDVSSIVGDLLQNPDVQDAIINEYSSEIESYIMDEYSSEIESYVDEYSSKIESNVAEATKDETEKNTEIKTENETNGSSNSGNNWWNDFFGGTSSVETEPVTYPEFTTVEPPKFESDSEENYYPETEDGYYTDEAPSYDESVEDTHPYDEVVTETITEEEWPDQEVGEFEFELATDESGMLYYTLTNIGTWRGKKLTIPAEYNGVPVKKIGYGAFMGARGIESVTILDGIEEIEMWAFGDCDALRQIYLPSTIKFISQRVFTYSDNVSFVHINESLTSRYYAYNNCILDRENNMLHTAFNCSNIEQTLWNLNVEKIGDDACRGVTTLTAIKIPDSVWYIGSCAFYDCTNLKMLNLGSSYSQLSEIHYSAFSFCESLESISMACGGNDRYLEGKNCIIDKKEATLVFGCVNSVIPNDGSIVAIGKSAFQGCTGLEYIEIPASVKTIEREAFDNCTNLKKVVLPYGLERIEYLAFSCTYNLYSLKMPTSIIFVDEEAFRGSAYTWGEIYDGSYKDPVEVPGTFPDTIPGINDGYDTEEVSNDIAWETDVEWDSGDSDIEWTPDYEISTLPEYEIEWSTSIIINGSYSEMMTGNYIEIGSGNSYFEIITGAYGSAYEVVTDQEGNTYYYYYAVPSPTEP